jgi:chromate transporter
VIEPLTYFWLLLKASLFSTSGLGNLPTLHQDLLARGWATERQFGESLAIGQISPGPSGLWVISLGYLTDGLRGALLATVAITLPPLLVLAIHVLYRRIDAHPVTEGFVRGLSLTVVGLSLVTLAGIMSGVGVEVRSLLIALAALGLGLTGRLPVGLLLGLAALTGVVFY